MKLKTIEVVRSAGYLVENDAAVCPRLERLDLHRVNRIKS